MNSAPVKNVASNDSWKQGGVHNWCTNTKVGETCGGDDQCRQDLGAVCKDWKCQYQFATPGLDLKNVPWNEDPASCNTLDKWCEHEAKEGLYACENMQGAGEFCKPMCDRMKVLNA